jgi:putative ABC transport system permease protein
VAILGVAFAILLVFMQLGFYGSAEMAATTLYDALDFDLVLQSRNYLNSTRPRTFPLYRLSQAREHPDVESIAPVYIDWQAWHIAQPNGNRRAILVAAFNLDDRVFKEDIFDHHAEESLRALRMPNTVLMDTKTFDYFGPRKVGIETELNHTRIKIVGEFTIGTGYGFDGLILTSDYSYAQISGASLDHPSLGLIRLKPEARGRPEAVKKYLTDRLYPTYPPDEVRILTREDADGHERDYWVKRTSVGVIFLMGVLVACMVGVIFVYQVIATDISDHFAEYATLKAIGYSWGYLSGVVLRQAVALAVLGYLPGYLAALALYALGRESHHLLLYMNYRRAIGVLLLSMAMCSVSGLLALRKVKAADPADLF